MELKFKEHRVNYLDLIETKGFDFKQILKEAKFDLNRPIEKTDDFEKRQTIFRQRQTKIASVTDINTDTDEGALLLMAIGTIMSLPGYTDKTPEEVIAILQDKAEKISEEKTL